MPGGERAAVAKLDAFLEGGATTDGWRLAKSSHNPPLS
jgi:hypothetical protein